MGELMFRGGEGGALLGLLCSVQPEPDCPSLCFP